MIRIIGFLFVLLGILELYVVYVGYQSYQYLINDDALMAGSNTLPISNWDVLWVNHELWVLGGLAIISGIMVFWTTIHTRVWFIINAFIHGLFALVTLFRLFINPYFGLDGRIIKFKPILPAPWIIIIILSSLALWLVWRKSEREIVFKTYKDWSYLVVVAAVLGTLVFM